MCLNISTTSFTDRQFLHDGWQVTQPDEAAKNQTVPNVQKVASEAKLLRGLLEDFLRLEQFEKDCHPTKGWMNHTIGKMSDDGHLNPINLNAKMQDHKQLEEDVMSHKNRVEVLAKYDVYTNYCSI